MKKVNCHNLKIESKYFCAVLDGSKKFEIRFDDRDYNEGDFIVLHEFINTNYTGRTIEKKIGFITDYEQKQCYIVFSLLDIS
jgi:hypothetical protein